MRVLYISLFLSIILQILIQYWQILISPHADIDNKMVYGIVFSIILACQSLAGVFVEKSQEKKTTLIVSCLSILVSVIILNLLRNNPISLIVSICLLFFSVSVFSSVSLSRLLESTPQNRRSIVMSSAAVASKISMFTFMPTSAWLIDKVGTNFNYILSLFSLLLGMIFFFVEKNENLFL